MLPHGVLDKNPNLLFQCSRADMKKFGLILRCKFSDKSQQVLSGGQNLSRQDTRNMYVVRSCECTMCHAGLLQGNGVEESVGLAPKASPKWRGLIHQGHK